jgi:hypothetical protein
MVGSVPGRTQILPTPAQHQGVLNLTLSRREFHCTPIKECLTLIRENEWPIYGIIEREYRDALGNAVEQTRAEMEYVKQILQS